MYLNVVLGNGTPIEPKRAKAGVEYPITIPTSGSVQETRITIAGGDYLSSISNLAPMYPYSLDFSHINHLKKFDMGTDEVGYVNTKLAEQGITSLGDGGGPLLEEVNVKNCHSLTELKSLNKSNNLKIVEATGTAITGIDLPDYTNIEILHLPSTIASFSLSNAVKLKDFYMKNNLGQEDYNNLYEQFCRLLSIGNIKGFHHGQFHYNQHEYMHEYYQLLYQYNLMLSHPNCC